MNTLFYIYTKKNCDKKGNMKDFTNQLCEILRSDFEDKKGETIGYNEKNNIKKMDIIKSNELTYTIY